MITEHKKEFATFHGTVAEFTADPRKWHFGDILLPSDSAVMYIGKGSAIFTALKPIPLTGPAAAVAPTGTNVPLTAIAGSWADLATANAATTLLRSDVQTHVAALEAKVDLIIAGQIAAKLMV